MILAFLVLSIVGLSVLSAQKPGERERGARRFSELTTLWLEKELSGCDVTPFIAKTREIQELASKKDLGAAIAFMDRLFEESLKLGPCESTSERPAIPETKPFPYPGNDKEREITIPFYSRPAGDFKIARTYHVAQNEPGASNSNDGLSPTYLGGDNGPFKDFNSSNVRQKLVGPSDGVEIVVHGGVYRIEDWGEGAILVAGEGDEFHPVVLSGASGETAILTPAASLGTKEPILLGGRHGIVQNLVIKRIGNKFNLLVVGKYAIVRGNVFEGPWFDDSIKLGDEAEYCLIFNNDISRHGSQAVDSFGSNVLIKNNHVHHDASGSGGGFGTKGGTKNHVYVGNVLNDLSEGLGGGGTGNLELYQRDRKGKLLHAATNVSIIGNTIYNIKNVVAGFQSCKDCLFEDNLVYDSFGGFHVGIRPDVFHGPFKELAIGLPSTEGVRIRNNRFANMTSGYIALVEADSRKGFASEGNTYYVDGEAIFAYRDREPQKLSHREFRELLGTDSSSVVKPLSEFKREE